MKKKLLILTMALTLAAGTFTGCKNQTAAPETTETQTSGETESDSGLSAEDNEKAAALVQQENDLFEQHSEVWEKVFAKIDNTETAEKMEQGQSYLELLKDAAERAKADLSAEELSVLAADLETIEKIEAQLAELGVKSAAETAPENTAGTTAGNGTFAAFAGNDLDGNPLDQSILREHKATVLNFWFNGCSACVNEMPDLEKFTEKLKEKDAQLIGVNALLSSEADIKEAKEILKKQGVTYKNITLTEGEKAVGFLNELFAFPTTVIVDQNGNIIGEPICGSLNEEMMNDILKQIDAMDPKTE